MKTKVVVPVLAICALAASAAPAGAAAGDSGQSEDNASCVALFVTHEQKPGFGQANSAEAQASTPYGRNVVSGFAHERLPCP